MQYAHKIGDHVMYLNNGVCKITDIREEQFIPGMPRTYFVLSPLVDAKSEIYVPVDSEGLTANIFELLTENEIKKAIKDSENSVCEWISDVKERSAEFSKIISTGNRAAILSVINTLTEYRRELESQKKKFYASDERIFNAANKFITEEFSFVLGIPHDKVMQYVLNNLQNDAS